MAIKSQFLAKPGTGTTLERIQAPQDIAAQIMFQPEAAEAKTLIL